MDAKELSNQLRNSNLIKYIGKPIKVSIETIFSISKCVGETAMYQPIPLTEEWLLNFGFKHIRDNWYNTHVNGNTFNVYVFKDLRYRVEIVSQSIGVFKYVHQLQNLYFALTGEELKTKP